MANLNFPSSPSVNQTYSANGRVWIYNGVAWVPYTTSNVIPPSTLLGRGVSASGSPEPILLGSGLSMAGNTLNSSAVGGGGGGILEGSVLSTGLIFEQGALRLTDPGSYVLSFSSNSSLSDDRVLTFNVNDSDTELHIYGENAYLGGSNLGDVTLNSSITDIFNISTQLISGKSASKDSLVFWDQSANKLTFLEPLNGISINGTGISLTDSGVTNAKLAGMVANTIKARVGTSGAPQDATIHQVLDFLGTSARGEIIFKGATQWEKLSPSISGYVLETRGTGSGPEWVPPPASSSVSTEATVGYIGSFLL
jgi:hypothetical protein